MGVKRPPERAFCASGPLPGASGSDLGMSQGLWGGSFGCPMSSQGASGRVSGQLGRALGAPEVSREGPGRVSGAIWDAPGASQERFFSRFLVDFVSNSGFPMSNSELDIH